MKLRNKKTGEIGELYYYPEKEYCFTIATEDPADMMIYKTIGGIWYDWEDYIPAEPLIKDEKIRKAVRAWAEAIDYRIDNLLCIKTSGNTRLEISDGSPKLIYISLFVDKGTLSNIKDRTYYTIAELCGEEEK